MPLINTALVALVLSVISTGFGVYQWWSSGRDEKIRAAIELSDRYIDQRVDAELYLNKFRAGQGGAKELLEPVQNQFARLTYVAFLANRGYVDPNYLSQRLICDLVQLDDPEAKAFNKSHPKACLTKDDQTQPADAGSDDGSPAPPAQKN
jgi:hypothetical protein